MPGHRTIVVPYHRATRYRIILVWLCSLQSRSAARDKVRGGGSCLPARSANAQVRMRLLSAFRNVSGADVKVLIQTNERVLDLQARGSQRSVSNRDSLPLGKRQPPCSSLASSWLALLPSRRLYEVLDAALFLWSS